MKINLKKGNFIPVISIISIYILSLVLMPYLTLKLINVTSIEHRYYVLLFWQIIAITIMSIVIRNTRLNTVENTAKRYSFLKAIGAGISFFFIMMLIQMVLSIILQILASIYGFNPISQNTQDISTAMKKAPILILYVVLFAPILEELVFRKAIFGYLYDIIDTSKEWIRFILAGILSGLAFAIPHDGISPIAVVYVVMSLVFAYLYRKTSNIVAPITAHVLMNLAVVLVQFYLV
ncbi:MAG: type II CAAX endopeptidase family protein [Gemella sp.]|nr:type II CAAX endopeptidase family protein [Gemella sp.]